MNKFFSVLVLLSLSVSVFSQRVSHRKVFVRPGPVVVNRNPVVVHRSPVVVRRSPVVVGRGPAFVNRPPAYYPYHGVSYRFSGGYFYRPFGNYWRVAPPPIGLRINFLPYGYSPLYVGPSLYYYNNGSYYRQYNDDSYEVVDPPMGATLSSLPKNAEKVTVNGETFYELNGTYYKKTTNDKGKTVYVVTGKDGKINNSADTEDQQTFVPRKGDVVDQLPDNCRTVTLDDATYYISPDDIYYHSIDEEGTTRYEVVDKPQADIQQ